MHTDKDLRNMIDGQDVYHLRKSFQLLSTIQKQDKWVS